MIEIFDNLSIPIKKEITQFIDNIFNNYELMDCASIIANFSNNCDNEELQDFIDFYFNLKMEQYRNDDDE